MTVDRPLLDRLSSLAEEAGKAILAIYAGDFEVESKADQSPLTAADLASHRVICDGLDAIDGSIPVLSEESIQAGWETRRQWQTYFLVDPLDGTREFVSRNGEFTVNIALIHEHRPVAGVVHVPVHNTTYFGARGLGAFRSGPSGQSAIRVRIPSRARPVVVGSRSHANPELGARLETLGAYDLVSMGSSLKFCLVADGTADFYPRLGPTSEWDTAAAQGLVEAAGGHVVRLDGSPLQYNTKDDILNPEFLVYGDDRVDWCAIVAGRVKE